jgi:Holliday junction resolvasome RuvABC endonuclease subunit
LPDSGHTPSGGILALDLGTATGWALRSAQGFINSGTERFTPGRFEGGGMRYLRFRKWLTELKSEPLAAVYFEEVRRHAGTDAAHLYGGFMATLTAWCEHHGIPYQGVPVGTIKKHGTGKGTASKPDMIVAARRLFPDTFTGHDDDNEADALVLLDYAVRHLVTVDA